MEKEISYCRELDKFPKLKEMVLEHEKGHAHDKNLLQVMIREARDYVKIYSTDQYWDFMKYINRHHNWWQLIVISLQNLVYQFFITIIYSLSQIIGVSVQFFRKVKKWH